MATNLAIDDAQLERLHARLAAVPSTAIEDDDYIQAARFYTLCRQKGVAGSPVDLLICAVSARTEMPVFTADRDFNRYARHLPIELHVP